MKTKRVMFPQGYEGDVCIHCETPREPGESSCCVGQTMEVYKEALEAIASCASHIEGDCPSIAQKALDEA